MLAPLATGVATIVCMLLPWATIPLAGMAGTLTGVAGAVPTEYSVLDAYNYIKMALDASNNDTTATAVVYGFMLIWAAGIAVTALGALLSLKNGVHKSLTAGGVCAAIAALAWIAGIGYLNQQVSTQVKVSLFNTTPWPIATAVLGVATAVLASGAAGAALGAPSPRPVDSSQTVDTIPSELTSDPVGYTQASCVCPSCGYTVEVEVPATNCTVNITCGHCGTRFPREIRMN